MSLVAQRGSVIKSSLEELKAKVVIGACNHDILAIRTLEAPIGAEQIGALIAPLLGFSMENTVIIQLDGHGC